MGRLATAEGQIIALIAVAFSAAVLQQFLYEMG